MDLVLIGKNKLEKVLEMIKKFKKQLKILDQDYDINVYLFKIIY